MATTNNAPDLSTIAPGDRVAIRKTYSTGWKRHPTWAVATVQRVTAARIVANGHTYRRSDGMRLGDGGPHQAAYLFPYDHHTAVWARRQAAMHDARSAAARACDEAATAARRGESVAAVGDCLNAARDALARLEQLQAQVPTTERPRPTTPAS